MAKTIVTVCTTCRRVAGGEPTEDELRPGTRMMQALQAAGMPDQVELRGVECLSACTRGCSIVVSGGPQKWTYVYGNLDPEKDAGAVLEGAARHAASENGIVPWRERPEIFRKQSIARIPPTVEI